MVLFVVVLYIFAIMGNSFFGKSGTLHNPKVVRMNLPPSRGAEWINGTCTTEPQSAGVYSCHDPIVFSTVMESMLTLFQIMTFDDWAPLFRPIGDTLPLAWIFMAFFAPIGALGLSE